MGRGWRDIYEGNHVVLYCTLENTPMGSSVSKEICPLPSLHL